METLSKDELVFDVRNQSDLFVRDPFSTPYYADVIKRWTIGNCQSSEEESIAVNILILNPDYILRNRISAKFIETLWQLLSMLDLQNPDNVEKGLLLYILFYLFLKTQPGDELIKILHELEEVFVHYTNSNIRILNAQNIPKYCSDLICLSSHQENFTKLDPIPKAYFEIISLVMDSRELLSLNADFNLRNLPLPPRVLWKEKCEGLRGEALHLYKRKEYDVAMIIYKRLRIEGFELPGTLVHMVRIELMIGNIEQAETHVTMAWRLRNEAPPYVLARILWCKLCLWMYNPINNEDYLFILGQLKTLLKKENATMKWDMEELLDHLITRLTDIDLALLTSLVDALSYTDAKLDEFPLWRELKEYPLD